MYAVMSDTHYYAPELGTAGSAYAQRSGSDQKCLAESREIIRAAFADVRTTGASAVLIAGDLTNNGERISHEEFRELLYGLQTYLPVYVITSTHDWGCDGLHRRYVGEDTVYGEPTLTAGELSAFYTDFGLNKAHSRHLTAHGVSSYAAVLPDGTHLIALNDDKNGKGRAGYDAPHMAYIEAELAAAAANERPCVLMTHHPLYPNRPLMRKATIGDSKPTVARLYKAGLRTAFVGHTHVLDDRVHRGVRQVNVPALCGYPGGYMLADGGTITYRAMPEYTPLLTDHVMQLVPAPLRNRISAYGVKRYLAGRMV
ncbi:MAG: metallophosphoesterase [Oscillospiraceae bacterium]|nr:metallophosphoesterase [Oscillospiraceae bacterium]